MLDQQADEDDADDRAERDAADRRPSEYHARGENAEEAMNGWLCRKWKIVSIS